jgi:hypothetical protein
MLAKALMAKVRIGMRIRRVMRRLMMRPGVRSWYL